MFNIGPQELLLILVIALIVVGPNKLPELGRSIGRGLREIRKAQDEVKRTIQVNLDEPSPSTTRADAQRARAAAAERDEPPGAPPLGSGGTAAVAEAGAVAQDPTPLASGPPAQSEVREISQTLGRSLAELRRAREEIQRSFRVDLDQPPSSRHASRPAETARPTGTSTEGAEGAEGGEPSASDATAG